MRKLIQCFGCIVLWQEVQRDKAEQMEKARLRHKHALAQLQLEEVRSLEHLLVISQYSRTLLSQTGLS